MLVIGTVRMNPEIVEQPGQSPTGVGRLGFVGVAGGGFKGQLMTHGFL